MENRKIIFINDLPEKNVFGRDLKINNYRQYLGQSLQSIYWDASNGLYPNAFAAIAATVKSGNNIFVYLPSYEDFDPDHFRLVDFGTNLSTCKHYFNERFRRLSFEKLVVNQFDNNQKASLKEFPLIILGKRGRGKSHFLANRINELSNCLLVLPFRSNFPFKVKAQKLPPDEALRLKPKADYLFVDEAAGIHPTQLIELTKLYPNYVLATTTDGYEGQGREFAVRIVPMLKNLHNVKIHEFTKAWRFQENDDLERFLTHAFLLNPTENQATAPTKVRILHQEEFQDETLLRQIFALLHQAHYRTTPEDLKRLLDLPNQFFFIAENNNLVSGVLQLLLETPLPNDLAIAVMRNQRRPQGRLLTQQLLLQTQDLRFNREQLRISRIAVQENLRKRGIARELIKMAQNLSLPLGVSFTPNESLKQFWLQLGFYLIKENLFILN